MADDESDKTDKEVIFLTIDDLVGELLYYGRKEDERLPVGAIESAIESGEITTAEMVERFAATINQLNEG
jgi:hypothetical protein